MRTVTPKDLSGLIRRLQTLCTAFQVNLYFHKSTTLLVDFIEIATLRTLFIKIHLEVIDFQPRKLRNLATNFQAIKIFLF